MAWSIDARIPVTLIEDAAAVPGVLGAGRPAALLAEGAVPDDSGARATESFAPEPQHPVACACCAGRSAAAQALDRLFQDRVRGRTGWFERVLVLTTTHVGAAEVRAALESDALASSRYRMSDVS